MNDYQVIEVCSSTQVQAFVPFTALPNGWKGRRVKISLFDETEEVFEEESMELPF